MNRFLLMGVVFFILASMLGCGQNDAGVDMAGVSPAAPREEVDTEIIACEIPDMLVFSSVEDFLTGYKDVLAGTADEELAALAESVVFLDLERLYLPMSIPEEYEFHEITLVAGSVNFWYLHEDDLMSDSTILNAKQQRRYFLLSFYRWDFDLPLEGIMRQFNATEADLIDGKYLFDDPNWFLWAADRGGFKFTNATPIGEL